MSSLPLLQERHLPPLLRYFVKSALQPQHMHLLKSIHIFHAQKELGNIPSSSGGYFAKAMDFHLRMPISAKTVPWKPFRQPWNFLIPPTFTDGALVTSSPSESQAWFLISSWPYLTNQNKVGKLNESCSCKVVCKITPNLLFFFGYRIWLHECTSGY